MTRTKAMAVEAVLLAGAVVRIELRKAGHGDPDAWWINYLETVAELLRPSPVTVACADVSRDAVMAREVFGYPACSIAEQQHIQATCALECALQGHV